MTQEIGWKFPPTNGGRVDGFNDPGIAHFSGSPLMSLARETIQNSLDARGTLGNPVYVSFELVNLRPEDVASSELADAIKSCERETQNDPIAERGLSVAQSAIGEDPISCLRVSDRNTTGLRGDQWRTLVKMQGVSLKPGVPGAGGSHGIGKYAPFAASDLRTVFYWTSFQQDGEEVEYFQGKSVLMSHNSSEGETQGTGFFGIREGCRELGSGQIPENLRVLTPDRRPIQGTCLTIAGYRANPHWRRNIAASVVGNFFYAIQTGALVVLVEPEGDKDLMEIDEASLGNWFDKLLEEETANSNNTEDENEGALQQAREFWQVTSEVDPTAERQDVDLGHCRLWVRVAEGLPSRVALVRRPGMLITTEQSRLLRFPGFKDFVAVCVFEDPSGNELLRRMENPQHNRFEPERLSESDRAHGRLALNRITSWIRSEIRKTAGPPEGGMSTVLTELAVLLPGPQSEDSLDDVDRDGNGAREPGFGDRVNVTLKPVRRRTTKAPPTEEEEDFVDGGDGNGTGNAGGGPTGATGNGGGTGGSGEGEGTGGTGNRGGRGPAPRKIPVSKVRVLPVEGRDNVYRLSFQADGSGISSLRLEEAGDSTGIGRDDIHPVDPNTDMQQFSLTDGERAELEITAESPSGGRAWYLTAFRVERD